MSDYQTILSIRDDHKQIIDIPRLPKNKILTEVTDDEGHYRTLNEIVMGYPYEKLINCHKFGIITNYYPSRKEIEIKDETHSKFHIRCQFANRLKDRTPENDRKQAKILEDLFSKIGNIVRFHRLQLKSLETVCAYFNDVMVSYLFF